MITLLVRRKGLTHLDSRHCCVRAVGILLRDHHENQRRDCRLQFSGHDRLYDRDSSSRRSIPTRKCWWSTACPSDDTVKIVELFRSPDIRLLSEKDKGVFDAMNKGLHLFQGDAVGFLNSDDTFHDSGVLEAIAEAMQDSDIVYGDLNMVTDHRSKRVVQIVARWQVPPLCVSARLGTAAPLILHAQGGGEEGRRLRSQLHHHGRLRLYAEGACAEQIFAFAICRASSSTSRSAASAPRIGA